MTAEGGDPACWLDQVCEVCGGVLESEGAHRCRVPADCPVCVQGTPQHVLRELENVWVTGAPRAPLPGYVCVVAKRHVVEPYDLPDDERAAFWEASMSVASALARVVRPIKMNYEIHGNTIPHLHLHLFPRFRGDPFEGRPIDGSQVGFERTPAELRALADAIPA